MSIYNLISDATDGNETQGREMSVSDKSVRQRNCASWLAINKIVQNDSERCSK